MSGGSLVSLVALIIALGVVAQVLADRFRVPSVLFLILAGILVGPVFGIVSLGSFGGSLSSIVGLSVAIIMFEAAFHLKLEKFQDARSTTLRLITVGAVIALVGTALTVRVFLGAAWDLSFLIGALLVATGPTVITPILQIVPVRDRVAAALELEGVTNDVTAAILTVAVFEFVTTDAPASSIIVSFAEQMGSGIFVGGLVAIIIWYLLTHVDLSPDNAPQNARLIVLAGALVAYAGASTVNEMLFQEASEAGIAAAVIAGLILGNANLPYEETIEAFKGDVSIVVLSFVFITLGALIQFDALLALGIGGIAVVLAVALVIRPAIVAISTLRTRITLRERVWMAAVSPRGIIPASVATLFALELRAQGLDAAATLLAGTVLLVILATVVVEGGFARHYAEVLDILPMRVLIIGGGKVGRALAERLEDRGENVVIIDHDQDIIEQARRNGLSVRQGDGTDAATLQSAGADNAKIVVAATGDDDANLLIAQLASSKFGVEQIITRVNDPTNEEVFADLDVRTISETLSTAWAIDNVIERPALSDWMTELGRSGDVQEIEITADEVVGRSIRDLDSDLPNGCLIALVGRNGNNQIPSREFTLEHGDHITVLGRQEAVSEALSWFHPHD